MKHSAFQPVQPCHDTHEKSSFSLTPSYVAGHHKFMEIFVPRKQRHNCGIFSYQERKSKLQAVSDQVPILTEKKIHTYPSRQTYSTNWQLPQKQQHQFFCDICRIHRSSNTRINITLLQEKTTGYKQYCRQDQKHSPHKLTKLRCLPPFTCMHSAAFNPFLLRGGYCKHCTYTYRQQHLVS